MRMLHLKPQVIEMKNINLIFFSQVASIGVDALLIFQDRMLKKADNCFGGQFEIR